MSEGLKLLIDPASTSPSGLFYSWANRAPVEAAEKFQVEGNYHSLGISWLVYCLWWRIPIFNSSGKCLREHSHLWWYSSSTSWYNSWGKTKDIYFKVLRWPVPIYTRVGYVFDLRFSEWKIQPISTIFCILNK